MTDYITPIILDTLALHLRRCAILTDDPHAVDIIMTCARQLDDRTEEIRDHQRFENRVHRANETPTDP
jgi:hypothetical protein